MKTLSLVFCFAMLTLSAFSQIETGTTVVIEYLPDRIILAADSLMVDSEKLNKDYCHCKLAALDKNAAFAASGIIDEPGFWDATEEAKTVYHTAVANHRSDLLAEITKLWIEDMRSKLTDTYSRRSQDIERYVPSGNLSQSIFAGVSAKGKLWFLRFRWVEVKDRLGPFLTLRTPTTVLPSDCVPICAIGVDDIPLEFAAKITERAKTEAGNWHIPERHRPDAEVMRMIHLVDLTIKYDPYGRVGGQVDALQITPRQGLRWFQRKKNCPKYQ